MLEYYLVIGYLKKKCLVECSPWMKSTSKLHALISSKEFLGLNHVFSVHAWYICLNLIDWQKQVHIVYSKLNLRPKSYLLEIMACNLEFD